MCRVCINNKTHPRAVLPGVCGGNAVLFPVKGGRRVAVPPLIVPTASGDEDG